MSRSDSNRHPHGAAHVILGALKRWLDQRSTGLLSVLVVSHAKPDLTQRSCRSFFVMGSTEVEITLRAAKMVRENHVAVSFVQHWWTAGPSSPTERNVVEVNFGGFACET